VLQVHPMNSMIFGLLIYSSSVIPSIKRVCWYYKRKFALRRPSKL